MCSGAEVDPPVIWLCVENFKPTIGHEPLRACVSETNVMSEPRRSARRETDVLDVP